MSNTVINLYSKKRNMNHLDLKLGIGWSYFKPNKSQITNEMIEKQAIEILKKQKEMNYDLANDHLDLYTSYFGGPGSIYSFRKQLENEFKRKFVLKSTINTKK